jgi:hypothetical protein
MRRQELRLASGIRRLGVASRMNAIAAAAASGTTPADLSNVVLWLEAAAGTVRNAADGTGGTMSDGETVGRFIRPGDSLTSPAFPYATQATAGDKPPLEIASSKYWVKGGSSDFLSLSPSDALAGDFVLWAVVKRTTATDLVLMANNSATASSVPLDSGNHAGLVADTGDASSVIADAAGTSLVRWRRSGSNSYFAATGIAEQLLSGTLGTGAITPDTLLALPGDGYFSASTAAIGAILISTNAGHAAAPPSYIDGPTGYFKTSTANVAAAWGVSL